MQTTPAEPHPALPLLLSFNAGYLDAAGFLALQGLFTAHVTGNFVTLGAALIFGTSGVLAKLLALPVFCIVVLLARLTGTRSARELLRTKLVLLVVGAVLAIALKPTAGDSWQLVLVGMLFVSAMALQNAIQRIHFPAAPATTVMTGGTTQLMIDLADALRRIPDPARRDRWRRNGGNLVAFALGCAAAAIAFKWTGFWCFALTPVVGLAAALLFENSRGLGKAHAE